MISGSTIIKTAPKTNTLTAPRRILFISYDGMTDPLGQSQVLPYLQGLSRFGYQFYLLSCEKEQVFSKNRLLVESLIKEYNITWVPLKYTKRPPVLSTLIDIVKLRNAAKKIHKEFGVDMVHTRTGVPALVGVWLKKKYGIMFLNDIREFYADSRVEGGMWNVKLPLYKAIYKFFKRKEAEQVKLSDGIVCLTYAAEKIIRKWPEYNPHIPFTVIPCSVDLDLFNPLNLDEVLKHQFRDNLNIKPGDFVISYLGSIGGWYLADEMMKFCKRISIKHPSTKFLFISPHQHDQIHGLAALYNISFDKIIVTGAARKEVPSLLSLSDYAIFFIKPCYSKLSSSPTKHGEIMAMGLPLITNSGVGDVEEVVNAYKAGFVLDAFDNEAFDQVIGQLESAEFDREGIRNGAKKFYALDQAVLKYIKIYKDVLEPAAK